MKERRLDNLPSQCARLASALASWDRQPNSKDRFPAVMRPFSERARAEADLLTTMLQRLEAQFASVSEYLAFDKARYSFEELFADLRSFCVC